MKAIKAMLKPIGRLLLLDLFRDPGSRLIFIWVALWILLGTVLFHRLEGWGWVDSFYFTIVSLTTVGYGDLTPTTPISKLVASFFLLNGVAILVALFGQVRRVRGATLTDRANQVRSNNA